MGPPALGAMSFTPPQTQRHRNLPASPKFYKDPEVNCKQDLGGTTTQHTHPPPPRAQAFLCFMGGGGRLCLQGGKRFFGVGGSPPPTNPPPPPPACPRERQLRRKSVTFPTCLKKPECKRSKKPQFSKLSACNCHALPPLKK